MAADKKKKDSGHLSHQLWFVSDSGGMWEEQEEEDGEDDEEEDEGVAGQLLSDLIASNKYGIGIFPVLQLFLCFIFILIFTNVFSCSSSFSLTEDDYYEDDEEDDPDALKDPIYQIDLQVQSLNLCGPSSNVTPGRIKKLDDALVWSISFQALARITRELCGCIPWAVNGACC